MESTPVSGEIGPVDGFRAVLIFFLLAGLIPPPFGMPLAALVVGHYYWRVQGMTWLGWGYANITRSDWFLVLGCLAVILVLNTGLLGLAHSAEETLKKLLPPPSPNHPLSSASWWMLVWIPLNAVAEEVVFRGILLRALLSRGVGAAVLLSSLLFGILHGIGFPSAFAFGLLAALLSLRYESLLPAMVLHSANNLWLWLLAQAVGCPFCTQPLLTWLILTLVLIVTVKKLQRPMRDFLEWTKSKAALTFRQTRQELIFTFKHGIPLFLLILSLGFLILSYRVPLPR